MNWNKRSVISLLLLTVLLLTLCGLPAPVSADGPLRLSPETQDFIRTLSEKILQAGEMVPDPITLSHARGEAVFPTAAYPAGYDLRAQGKLTPVKNQNPYGTCWAFASLASLESGLMPGPEWNFSENHLVRWSGFDNAPQGAYDHGGNATMAAAYLARWQGPVNEADSPYIDPSTPSVLTVQKHVQEVLFLPPRAGKLDNDNIKGALTTYGAVTASVYWDDLYFSDATNSYYYDAGGSTTNHLVAIVGWDDNYNKSHFTGAGGSPSGNGAFIVRNSWGSAWGESGYFYLSYYDNVVGWFRVFNNAEAATNYGRAYQYDPLGWIGGFGYSTTTAWFANVFTAQASESLAAVGFYTTDVNAAYEVYLKTNFSGASFVGPLVKSGSFTTPGYHTVGFAPSIAVTAGSRFCVAVKVTTPNDIYPIPIECAVAGYSSGASSSPGQSYVSQFGANWTDITTFDQTANVCLKAFTTSVTPVPTIGWSPSSLAFQATQGGLNPLSKTLSIWNAGAGALNWNAVEGAAWLSLSPTTGASTGETDLISAFVDIAGLTTGTYSATITLSAAGASNSPQQAPVTLVVNPSGPGVNLNYDLVAGWNMISIPLALINPSPDALLPLGWPLYAWDAVQGIYLGRAQILLSLGDGYWLKAPTAQPLVLYGPANEQTSTAIPLEIGWNMIGTPYHQPVSWGAVTVTKGAESKSLDQAVAAGWIQSAFYRWTGTTYQLVGSGGIFQPTSGCWVKTLQAGCAFTFPKP
ncbi:MAG: lectin like domain-containing protein [bacterium]